MASRARRWSAMVCLPPALGLVLSGLFSARTAAAATSSIEEQIRAAARGPYVRLTLFDGRQVVGSYQGFLGDWQDSVASSIRFERWRASNAPTVPRIGDAITIVAGADTLRGSFWGFIPSAVLIAHSDAAVATSVPFGTISSWLPDREAYDASWPSVRERVADAPTIAAVALEQGARRVVVTREQIAAVEGSTRNHETAKSVGTTVVVAIIAGAIGALIICAVVANDVNNDLSNCTFTPSNRSDAEFARARLSAGSVAWRPGETQRP